jgi:lipopolysaccharide export LptBFGC system permease protein LptF
MVERIAKLSESEFTNEINHYLKDPTISKSLRDVILSDRLEATAYVTTNQNAKQREVFDNLLSDKSFQSIQSTHPPSPPDSNRINNSIGSESENSENDDNFILRNRKKQRTSKSARMNNIRKWLIENAPIKKFDEFHPAYQTEYMTSLQETQKTSNLKMKAKIIDEEVSLTECNNIVESK